MKKIIIFKDIYWKLYILADIGATPFGLNSLGGLAGLESLGLGQSTFMDLQVKLNLKYVIVISVIINSTSTQVYKIYFVLINFGTF